MKRILVLMMALSLVVGAVASAEAGKKKKKPKKVERTVEGTYDGPTLVIAGFCGQSGAIGCVELVAGANESFVTAEVTDAHGQPVFVQIGADTDGNNQDDTSYGSFCGSTDEPLVVDPGATLHFWVGVSPDPSIAGCVPGLATTGKITATFSNLP